MAVYAAQIGHRQEEPGTGIDIISRRLRPFGVHLRELTLSACQTLFGGGQQPLDGLGAVAFDDIPIVIQTAVAEDTEIELRGGVAALGGENEVLDSAALHQRILTTGEVYCSRLCIRRVCLRRSSKHVWCHKCLVASFLN